MKRWLLRLLLAVVVVVGAPRQLGAENLGPGGGMRVITGDEAVGPYRLLITSSPEPAQVGQVTIAVRVTDLKTGETVKDADVRVTLTLPDADVDLEQAATHADAGSPVDYAAHLEIVEPGQYDGFVRITGPAGPAEVRFTQRVLPSRTTSTLLVLALPFAAVLAILGFWYLRSGSRNVRRP
jgi:hypothetical protein